MTSPWIALPQGGVVAGQSGHVSDHDLIEPALATLWGAAMQSFYNVCAPPYNADPTGLTDSTAAINAAISAASAAGGGVVYFPAGTFLVTPTGSPAVGLSLSGVQGVRLVGSGALASVIKKNGAGVLINMSGPSTDTTGATHCKYCSIENLGLNGNTNTGLAIQIYYADNLHFDHVRIKDNYDICIDTAEFWDSRFYNLVIETSGSLGFGTSTPNIMLRNSAATSGFGYSSDNVDQIHFVGCRWEDFRQGAVWIQRGVNSTNNPNGIFITDCKMESSFIRGGPHFSVDSNSRGIYVDALYCFSGGFGSGFSTAQDVIVWSPNGASTLENVFISNRSSAATVQNGVTVSSPNTSQNVVVENVVALYNIAPTGAHINFATLSGGFKIENCNSTLGTLYSGTMPTGLRGPNANLVQTFTSSGTWTMPPNAVEVTVMMLSGGGGGGSGAVEASGTVASGGAGGGGGAYTCVSFPASALAPTEAVTVGAGGTGGASVGVTASSGNAGTNGGNSNFGSASMAVASAGTGGAGGSTGAAAGGTAGTGSFGGGGGAASIASGAAPNNSAAVSMGATGGAAGGGITTGAVASAGSAGGIVNAYGGNPGGTAGTSGGGSGGAGNAGTSGTATPGTGGGGGGASTTGNGGAGGAGGNYGAGGGGGGSALTGSSSGAGGNGAPGIVIVTTKTN